MSKTNSLTSHTGERETSPANKMSGMEPGLKKQWVGKSKKFIKHFANKKRRALLKSNEDKI
jgi:hypothetical protein